MKKRLTALILCLLLAAAVLPFGAAAATVQGRPTISLSSAAAAPGGDTAITVSISDNPGLMAMVFTVEYDHTCLTLTGAADGGLKGWDCSGDRILWLGDSDSAFNGAVITLNFRVLSAARAGDAAVTLRCSAGDVANHDETVYVPVINPGKVTVTGSGWTPAQPDPVTPDEPDDTDDEPDTPKEPADPDMPFTDVPKNAYYHDAVVWAYKAAVTNGRSETIFDPKGTCNRGEVVTFLWRAAGRPEPESAVSPYEDVTENDYFFKPVLWAVEKGITLGTDAAHFSPRQTCSTAHIVTFIYRALGIGSDGWYQQAGSWASENGLLSGTSLTVDPAVQCPRGAVVTFLYRWAQQQ